MDLRDTTTHFLADERLSKFQRTHYKELSCRIEVRLTDITTFEITVDRNYDGNDTYTIRDKNTTRYLNTDNVKDVYAFIDKWNNVVIRKIHDTKYDEFFNNEFSYNELTKIFEKISKKEPDAFEITIECITDEDGGLEIEFKSYRYENEQEREKRLETERKKTEERELKRLQRLEKEQQEKQSKIDKLKAELAALENSIITGE